MVGGASAPLAGHGVAFQPVCLDADEAEQVNEFIRGLVRARLPVVPPFPLGSLPSDVAAGPVASAAAEHRIHKPAASRSPCCL